MKKIIFITAVLSIAFLISCKKDKAKPREIYPKGPAVAGQWRQMLDTNYIEVIEQPFFSIGNKGFTINQQTNEVYEYDATLNKASKKNNFPGQRRQSQATAFAIGNKGYYGLGLGRRSLKEGSQTVWQFEYKTDFWEYDPATDAWTEKKSLPVPPNVTGVPAFIGAYGIGIGNKGYVGSGLDNHFHIQNYLFEYDQQSGNWTQKDTATYAPGYSQVVVAFSIGNKGYIGDSTRLWEYNPSAPVSAWKVLSAIPNTLLKQPVTSLGSKSKGYIYGSIKTLNSLNPQLINEFWEFVPGTGSGTWNKLADFAGTARGSCPGFILNEKVYLGFGSTIGASVLGDVWEYTPL